MKHLEARFIVTFAVAATLVGVGRPGALLDPGEWEITTTTEMAGLPPQTAVHVQCLTVEDLVPMSEQARSECRIADVQVEENTVTWTIACGDALGGMSGVGRAVFEGDRMEGTMTMTIAGHGTEVVNTIAGRRLGACAAATQKDLAALIVGEWELAPYGGVLSGWIAFQENGTYETEERHVDGVGVGRKGGYLLDAAASPPRIRLCTGDCGAPGSEWTSLFCVLRPHGEDRLEIFFSPDGSYPTGFDSENADHTMILDRRRP